MSGPIRHIVMWRLRGRRPRSAPLPASRSRPCSRASRAGSTASPISKSAWMSARSITPCDVVLFSEFTDQAALAAYANHPEHLRVREALGDLRIGRFQVDYPIKETGA